MNLVHVHLLLNHFPTVGMVVGLSIYLIALATRSNELKRVSLIVFVMISLIAVPTFASGNAAQEMIAKLPGISQALVDAHNSAAIPALIVMEFTGIFAWLGLWRFRRDGIFPSTNLTIVLLLAVVTFVLMAQTASIGGEITHPEIRAAQPSAAFLSIDAPNLAKAIKSSKWIWAASETLHFMGMSMLFGVVLLIDLRVLGFMKRVAFPALHQTLPWAIYGFALNVFTGMVFFIAASSQYTTNVVFHWKMALILLAGLNALYFTLFDETWDLKVGEDATARSKAMAAAALVLWIGVIYAGRMLPFIGNAF
ncbi:MAG: hypothetical protein ABI824_20120 [Acidobacteriota bacterium]